MVAAQEAKHYARALFVGVVRIVAGTLVVAALDTARAVAAAHTVAGVAGVAAVPGTARIVLAAALPDSFPAEPFEPVAVAPEFAD